MRGMGETNAAKINGCWVLHDTARMEIEIYGEIMSESVAEHVKDCHLDLLEYTYI